jgi:beta-1,4-mannosyl-glycoprotein beta-1,4-N-acetylglucosaminyltransferase
MIDGKKIVEMIYFSTELDILDLRLHSLDNIIDKFIIVEYPFNYARQSCPMYYNENKERFKEFEHKIVHVIDDFDYNTQPLIDTNGNNGLGLLWNRKTSPLLYESLSFCDSDDFVIITDGDALIKKEAFYDLDISKLTVFFMKWGLYWFNYFADGHVFGSTFGVPYKDVKDVITADVLKQGKKWQEIGGVDKGDAGWHFCKCGGVDKVIENIKGYPHQEYNVSEFTDKVKVQERIDNGWGWTDTSKGTNLNDWKFVYEDYKPENYPQYLNENPNIFEKYFKGGML